MKDNSSALLHVVLSVDRVHSSVQKFDLFPLKQRMISVKCLPKKRGAFS